MSAEGRSPLATVLEADEVVVGEDMLRGACECSWNLLFVYYCFSGDKRRTDLGVKLLVQIPKKGVTHLLGSMTLNSTDGFCETVVLILK